MNEYVHKLDINNVLHNHARSIIDSLETLLPTGEEYRSNCSGRRIGSTNHFLVRLEKYDKGNYRDPILSVEYDTRQPSEIKISFATIDTEKVKEKLSIDQL